MTSIQKMLPFLENIFKQENKKYIYENFSKRCNLVFGNLKIGLQM